MPRTTPVSQVMTKDVLSFAPDENVVDAMKRLVDRGLDAGPVVDGDGAVVAMLSAGDLIVQETQLHFPTVISLLGATLEWPSSKKKFDEDLRKALGATVNELMTPEPTVCGPDDTIEAAATLMHQHDVSRLPVIDELGVLVGIVSRKDILKVIVRDDAADVRES